MFDERAELIGRAYREFGQHFPRPGWVEHDADEIWDVTQAVAGEALADAGITRPGELGAVGITNQRETVCAWDPETGEPLHRAIVWQDRRTASRCDELRDQGREQLVRERTGLVLDPYFSATKIEWLLGNVEGLRDRARSGRAMFGTVDAWLIYKLTGERASDASNASRTMLFDIAAGNWDLELLDLFGIPERALASVVSSSGAIATTRADALHGHEVPIAGVAGDQQAALFGQLCVNVGDAKNTYGTGCFLLQNIGGQFTLSKQKLITTIACSAERKPQYALEGSIFIGGAVVQWLRDKMQFFDKAPDIAKVAASVQDSGNLVLVPAFTGLGAPHWDPYASGMLIGLGRDTEIGHIARAALESIAFQVTDVKLAMQSDTGTKSPMLKADGGAAANDILMQFQADVLGIPVERPAILETTAQGAAYLAGLAVGYWSGVEEIAKTRPAGQVFEPQRDRTRAQKQYARWQDAVGRAKGWNRVTR